MYRILLMAVLVAVVSARLGMWKCSRIFRTESLRCCAKFSSNIDASNIDLIDCFETPIKPMSCDREICIAKKKGYLSGTSSFDKNAVLAMIDKNYADDKELREMLKEKCVEGDLREYGAAQMCDLLKLNHCTKLTLLSVCPEFNDNGECNGMKGLVENCTM